MRLIDADAVISKVEEVLNKGVYKTMIVELIRNAPTFDYDAVIKDKCISCFNSDLNDPEEDERRDKQCAEWLTSMFCTHSVISQKKLFEKAMFAGFCESRVFGRLYPQIFCGRIEETENGYLRARTEDEIEKYWEDFYAYMGESKEKRNKE